MTASDEWPLEGCTKCGAGPPASLYTRPQTITTNRTRLVCLCGIKILPIKITLEVRGETSDLIKYSKTRREIVGLVFPFAA